MDMLELSRLRDAPPIRTLDDSDQPQVAARDARNVRLIFGLVLATSIACSFYASIDARGLYHDGVFYLFRIAETQSFHLGEHARVTVQALRQAPIVFLSNLTSLSVFELGQVFTFVLLVLPILLIVPCWFIVRRGCKAWMLFPLAYLLIGFAPTSIHANGEAAIAASYFWILLFLILFRARDVASQALFLLLCIPAFKLHEGGFSMMAVLLFACAMRWRGVKNLRERLFLCLSILLIAAIFAYEMRWIIYPLLPADRAYILFGLRHFQFLYVDGHLNLPLVTGATALLALTGVFFVLATRPVEKAASAARTIALVFALFAVAAIAAALLVEKSFSPFAQLQARYHPVFVSAALGTAVVLLLELRLPERFWMQPATAYILIALCAAQTAADFAATRRWHAFVVDLRSRLADGRGLIPWEATLHTGDRLRDMNWRLMAVSWVIPVTSIVYSPGGRINSIINLPAGTTYRPVDPEKPDQLPKLRGVDYTPYQRFFAARNDDTLP
jgi:hypothetical protein